MGPVLVANRGEIARRVIHAARLRGIGTVAVHSDADAAAPFVAEADCAVRLPGVSPADTYLDAGRILAAARAAGARAIHPGYGFLSENAAFARAVIDAGLTWIGPPPEAIEAMGSKTRAKEMMAAAGVPVLDDLALEEVTGAHLPVLVKASAGGGGRGMRVVANLDELVREHAAAAAEAGGAFGDDTVFIERFIASGRHIEVQLIADGHGGVWAVGERECSIQRRHQKVIEEAPSPLVEAVDGMRDRLFDAARAAARAVGYAGAGTVEFLADAEGGFFFLEMNTRLQVEHPVTEATTGLDLVGLQFDIAAGLPLPAERPPAARGWAVEARLYAEDPAHDYRPASGELLRLALDDVVSSFSGPEKPGIRLDSGVAPAPGAPATVGTDYDAMLAKVISYAPTRAEAVARLSAALRRGRIHGLGVNRDLLVRVLDDPGFRAGEFDTSFLDAGRLAAYAAPLVAGRDLRLALFAAAVALEDASAEALPTPAAPVGFRTVGRAGSTTILLLAGEEQEVRLIRDRRGTAHGAGDLDGAAVVESRPLAEGEWTSRGGVRSRLVRIADGGVTRPFTVTAYPGGAIAVDQPAGSVQLVHPPRHPDLALAAAEGSLLAPMPGSVLSVRLAVGDRVAAGDVLLSMEAMKMEHGIRAGVDGVVAELPVAVGDQVAAGTVLAVVHEDEEE
ncbi:acetyl-CoA carboxylase subunit alpha [Corynebacterium sphenisci DSM 44792]|uniref:Acetyl-CoA carboxylase subunit alpha n=1 Tax=Corynebacterium sphenisci DSM 44792 TaxID=1437874 RepID=A0A1L7CWQ6_9CORY|nr:acetyl-CoA carboxylase subunit alpha [Corynebacterium sphenisci DSM 44792]